MENDKSLFFLTLSLISIWLIVDNYIGKKYVNTFLTNMFGLKGLINDTTTDNRTDMEKMQDGDYNVMDDMTDDKGLFDVPTIIDIFGNDETSTVNNTTGDTTDYSINPYEKGTEEYVWFDSLPTDLQMNVASIYNENNIMQDPNYSVSDEMHSYYVKGTAPIKGRAKIFTSILGGLGHQWTRFVESYLS